MRLKCNPACCAFAWSPSVFGTPAMVAAASFNGAMSDDFGSDATLSIYLADTTQTDEEAMRVVGHITIPDRACRVDWSVHTGAQGVIAVACTNGNVYVYSAAKILQCAPPNAPLDGQKSALLWTITEHAGAAVRGCHFNTAQPNCLATGGDDGQWFVWSLPASAADKSAPQKVAVIANAAHTAAIVDVRWHAKNAFIIATASTDGAVKVWNLSTEKMASSLNVQRVSRGATLTAIAWHPTAATLAVGLDDAHPVVQIWDLRKAMSPTLELTGHARGVTGLSWCTENAELIASCDAVGHTYWWNAQTGEKSGELAPESNYVVDVQWSPLMPGVLATSSFEPSLRVSTAQSSGSASGAAPEWMKRPCGASINVVNVVASLAPGSDMSLHLTRLRDAPLSPDMESDVLLQRELAQLPAGSPELQHWLHRRGYALLSAVSASRADRQPILHFLSESSGKHKAGATGGDNGGVDPDDPFAELAQEQEKTFDERAAELVAKGQIEEAVDMCLNENRFDDAFTLAMLRGVDLVNKTRDAYMTYTLQQHPERRHVLYAGAIATGNYAALIRGSVPWREALSAIVSFAGDDFADACNQLGDVLKSQNEADGAYTCYVCSRNVDAVVELWREQGRSALELVRDAHVLEETADRRCTHPFLADCLCEVGTRLLYGGHHEAALGYLQRAAEMGETTAQQLVDRVRYCVPAAAATATAPPFAVQAVSDQPSPKAQMWAMQRQASAAAPLPTAAATPPQGSAPASGYPNQAPQNAVRPPQPRLQAPVPQLPAPAMGSTAPFHPSPAPMPPQHPPQQSPQHPPQQPPQQMTPPMTASARPPLMPGAAAQQSSLMPGFMAPPAQMNAVQPPPPPSSLAGGRPSTGPANTGSGLLSHIPAPTGPSQPRLMPHPVSAFSSMRAGSTPGSASSPALPGGALPPSSTAPNRGASQPYAGMPSTAPSQPYMPHGGYAGSSASAVGSLTGSMVGMPMPMASHAPQQQQPQRQSPRAPPPAPAPPSAAPQVPLGSLNANEIGHPAGSQTIQQLQQILPHITDARRRGAIEQSAVQLFHALRAQQLPDDLVQGLYQLVCNAGSPTVRTIWSQVSARHAQAVQPFANLRFL